MVVLWCHDNPGNMQEVQILVGDVFYLPDT